MKAIIFLGPSLPVEEARQVLDAMYLPPAAQSDLLSAVTTYSPDVIGLIDGVFRESLSVWHKEILYALKAGVRVYGASSMGALRAAETAAFGMVGIGEIYQQYASGELTDDDEVALLHTELDDGYRALSEPMVNVRATLRRAVAEGVTDAETADRLVTLAKAMYFPERTFQAVFSAGLRAGIAEDVIDRVREFVTTSYVDLKRDDALALLRAIRDLPDPLPPLDAPFTMTRSHLFAAQYDRDRTVQHGGVDVSLASIGDFAALHLPDFNDINFAALNRHLVTVLAALLRVDVTAEDIEQERTRFRIKHGLKRDDRLAEWLAANDLHEASFTELMHEIAICRRLHRWLIARRHFERTTRIVLDELRIRNRYHDVAEDAAAQERVLRDHIGYMEETVSPNMPWKTLVLEHLRETECTIDLAAPLWAEEAGFGEIGELCVELQRARMVRNYQRDLVMNLLTWIDDAAERPDPAGG